MEKNKATIPGTGPARPVARWDAAASFAALLGRDIPGPRDGDGDGDGGGDDACAGRSILDGSVSLGRVDGLDAAAAIESLQTLESLRSWIDAQAARLTDRLAAATATAMRNSHGLSGQMFASQTAATELAAGLRIPQRTAATRIGHSYLLTHHQHQTLTALETGHLSWRHATIIAEYCTTIPEDAAPDFERRLISIGTESTTAQLGDRARRLRDKEHPTTLEARHQNARSKRNVDYCPAEDGMAWLSAYLPAEQAIGIHNRLTQAARHLQTPTESRTLPQLRADILTDLLTHTCPEWTTTSGNRENSGNGSGVNGGPVPESGSGGNDGPVPESGRGGLGYLKGIHAQVLVMVPALTLLERGDEPGDLEGYGPIAPSIARELAAHAPSFTRVLTHPETGAVLSIGRDRYKIPKDLKTWLRVRDKTCRHPGCNRIAAGCEIDHTTPWYRGGPSNHNNLAHLCRFHHRLKSEGFWHYTQPQPGTLTATSPAGKTYTTKPEPPPKATTTGVPKQPDHIPPPF